MFAYEKTKITSCITSDTGPDLFSTLVTFQLMFKSNWHVRYLGCNMYSIISKNKFFLHAQSKNQNRKFKSS